MSVEFIQRNLDGRIRRRLGGRVDGMKVESRSSAMWLGRSGSFALLVALTAHPAAIAQGPGFVGLSSVGAQYFENENLLFYVPEAFDRFGASLAAGDFNGDGADDLATGVPYDNGLAGFEMENVGLVVVRYGVRGRGLETGLADTVLRGTAWPAPENRFGSALAAGDFNGDGFDDLAVGEPGYGSDDIGVVHVFYGASAGIHLQAGHTFAEHPITFSWSGFGSVLAAGNFNGDPFCDLAVGMPHGQVWNGSLQGSHADFGNLVDVGAVMIVEGASAGLRPTQTPAVNYFSLNQFESQIPDFPEAGDLFGYALAVGNFNGDTRSIGNQVHDVDDLAIGIPGEDGVGAVLILYGSQFNLLFGSSVFLGQWDLGESPEQGDYFGLSLAAEDFDGNGADDLAIGAPFEDFGGRVDTGLVTVLYSQFLGPFNFGLTEWWSQASIYGAGFARDFDHFGFALAGYDYDPHFDAAGEPFGIAALAIGTPGMSTFQGGFTVVRGTTAGLGPVFKVALFGPEFGPAPDTPQPNQSFGSVLTTGDFDGNGYHDLAIGHPERQVGGLLFAGAELVLYGSTFADGFEEFGDLSAWSSATP